MADEQTKKNWQAGYGVPYAEALLHALADRVERGEPVDDVARAIVAAYRDGEFLRFKRRKPTDSDNQMRIAELVERKVADGIEEPAAISDVADEIGKDRSVVARYHRKYGHLMRTSVLLADLADAAERRSHAARSRLTKRAP